MTRPRSARSRGAPSGRASTVGLASDRGRGGSSSARRASPAPEKGYASGGGSSARGSAKAPHAAAERGPAGNGVRALAACGENETSVVRTRLEPMLKSYICEVHEM